ncbi:MAG: FAD-dependent oxidoreductase [bacterium]
MPFLKPPARGANAAAQRAAAFQEQFGGRHQVLSAPDCKDREPALAGATRPIAGAIYLPDAEVGDCNRCCHELSRVLVENLGGTILYDTTATGFQRRGNRVTAMECGAQIIAGDVFVMAAGMDTLRQVLGKFAGKKPMTSVLGLSLTFPLGDTPPDLSVTDSAGKFVMVRLGDRLRVAGTAVFSDRLQINREDVARLMAKARALMPGAADYAAEPDVWVGSRPQTPDDLPMIGQAGADNLFVNAGHGSLGWTLAFGSAEILLQKITAGR